MPRTNKRRGRSGVTRLRVHFLGAARNVTGSLHFFEYTDEEGKVIRFFVDAGLAQEDESLNFQNRLLSGLKASDVHFGILTHAHNDHTGYIPKLYKEGFRGPVYCTPPTAGLLSVLLPDSGHIQEEEARQRAARETRRVERVKENDKRKASDKAQVAASKRGQKGQGKKNAAQAAASQTMPHTPAPAKGSKSRKQGSGQRRQDAPRVVQPALYTQADATQSLTLLKTVPFDTRFKAHEAVVFEFKRASHLLGAAVVALEVGNGNKKRRIVMSGDIGRPDMPVLKNIVRLKRADYIFCEGTYGDRLHPERDRVETLAEQINAAYERATKKAHPKYGHGVILIPAFAIGRVQSVLFDLRQLMVEKKIPSMPVYVDSPMAIRANAVYRTHVEEYNAKAVAAAKDGDPFTTPEYTELMEYSQSMQLDEPHPRPIIVLSSSGMASGGRVVRHLKQRLPGSQNTIIFAGFQSDGTLGRNLMNNKGENMMVGGEEVNVRATIQHIQDYSGHGDYRDILNWLSAFSPAPKKLFLVHGDNGALSALKERIEGTLHWNVEMPAYRQYADLD